jgi:hypothetical protein
MRSIIATGLRAGSGGSKSSQKIVRDMECRAEEMYQSGKEEQEKEAAKSEGREQLLRLRALR